jgi:hypothetical protein
VAVLGDHDASVLALQAVYDLREPVLDVGEGHLLSDQHSENYRCFRRSDGSDRRPGGYSIMLIPVFLMT